MREGADETVRMNLPLIINQELKEAEVEYVARPDFRFLDEWRRDLGKDTHPVRVDAVNFASLACKRYKSHAPIESYTTADEDIRDYVRDNPRAEVATFALMRCRWLSDSDVVGLAHFRR